VQRIVQTEEEDEDHLSRCYPWKHGYLTILFGGDSLYGRKTNGWRWKVPTECAIDFDSRGGVCRLFTALPSERLAGNDRRLDSTLLPIPRAVPSWCPPLKLVYVLNRDATGKPTIASPQTHRNRTITFDTVAHSITVDNPIFATLELQY
jgi:hypothetical protein